ncbi:MAG: Transglutaminase protein [Microgenomates group bacterium Gr01-1014_7]|nr:MAG: Transglutaminase protein [Microgenomates group bacterium Gr01-1014_7]
MFPYKVLAAEEFATSYDVIYDVGTDGVTTVTEKVNLRNLTSEYYASEFKLIIGATQISDIRASDSGGSIEVKQEQSGTSTTLSVKFNQQVVGKDKVLPWTLQFKSKDFAEKIGKVWEVRAPKVSSGNLEGYNLTISVPLQFGDPTLISPTPKTQTQSGGKMFLTFEKSQLQQSGVSASFGTFQLFDFDLSYHLDNTNLVPILTSIALPPDTAYQDVILQRIEPQPLNVTVDDDGNYLAWYRLNRNQKIDVKVIGSAKLYSASKVKSPTLPGDLRAKYTKTDKYWEKDNLQIQAKLSEILGSAASGDPAEKVKLIYHYVVNSLKYDSSRLKGTNTERLGAVTALNNPTQAVCMEFTDLFISLARAAGIPARELDGFAYTANPTLRPLSLTKDILHAWPEYWDGEKGWVMVDPTWENTTGGVDYFDKLDLNHFSFVIKGSSSEYPIPAGSYKYIGEDSQDVKVTLSENDFLGKPQLDVQIEHVSPILAGFPGKIKVKISNSGNAVYPSNSFKVEASQLKILNGEGQNLGLVPAFGNATFDFNIRTKSLFDNFNDQITVLIGGQKFLKEVRVKPFILFQTAPMIATGILSFMGVIYLGVLGGLVYRKRFLK